MIIVMLAPTNMKKRLSVDMWEFSDSHRVLLTRPVVRGAALPVRHPTLWQKRPLLSREM